MISVHTEVVKDIISISPDAVKTCVCTVLLSENIKTAEVTVIFNTANELKRLKKEFLSQDLYTDVIAFRLDEGKHFEGEIYISPEIAHENANKFHVAKTDEITRLIIHGTLHLAGYDDNTPKEQSHMRQLEEKFLDAINPDDLFMK